MRSIHAKAAPQCGIHHLDSLRADARDDNPVLKGAAHDVGDCREWERGECASARADAFRVKPETCGRPDETERSCATAVGARELANPRDWQPQAIPASDAG
jgi:hypothetical protein